jgi:hypothetical protein
MIARPGGPAVTTVFAVVGEHRDDPDRLLLLGEDGVLYDLNLPDATAVPVEPDERWTVDPAVPAAEEVAG